MCRDARARYASRKQSKKPVLTLVQDSIFKVTRLKGEPTPRCVRRHQCQSRCECEWGSVNCNPRPPAKANASPGKGGGAQPTKTPSPHSQGPSPLNAPAARPPPHSCGGLKHSGAPLAMQPGEGVRRRHAAGQPLERRHQRVAPRSKTAAGRRRGGADPAKAPATHRGTTGKESLGRPYQRRTEKGVWAPGPGKPCWRRPNSHTLSEQ